MIKERIVKKGNNAVIVEKSNPEVRGTVAGRCVGWMFEGEKQVFPTYSETEIVQG